MPRIPSERKEAILKKFISTKPNNIKKFAKEEGIATSTLYAWLNEKPHLMTAMTNNAKPKQFSAKTKLAFVAQSYSMTEYELSQFCRENGLYVEQIEQWREECLSGFSQSGEQKKTRKKTAEKRVATKGKSLSRSSHFVGAEKKLRAFYGEEPEVFLQQAKC